VLFSGTLTDTDSDPSNLFPITVYDIGVSFASGLTLDNTFFFVVPGLYSGDPNYATDQSGAGQTSYYGPLFGIDIAPGTPLGPYSVTVTLYALGGLNDQDYQGFTVTQDITVDVVSPEPAAAGLLFSGLLAFAVGSGVKRKCCSAAASR
jgi:hypothetical protein